MREGIGTVLHSPWLWITLVIASVSTIFLVGPGEAALPLLVKQRFGTQVEFYALLTSLSALGSVLAAFWLWRFKRLRRRELLTYVAWLLASVALLAMGLPLPMAGLNATFFIQGAAKGNLRRESENAEAALILRALRSFEGNVAWAAAVLGISRTTLWRKKRLYRL